ncbi:MAG: hypothetical protein WCN92_07915 [Eubacteriales bacterium]
MTEQKSMYLKIADNRRFCMVWLIVGAVYITWFTFLENPFYHTASVIAVDHRILFYFWVLVTIVAMFLNVKYMYRHNDYEGKIGKRLLYASFLCVAMTAVVPHAIGGVRGYVHWIAALSFGALCAAAVILFLISKLNSNRRYIYTLVFLVGVLVLMLVLLKLFAENGVIESLPMLCVYGILFLVNFTDVYHNKSESAINGDTVSLN